MEMVRQLIGYLNIILAAVALIILFVLLARLAKMSKTAAIISDDANHLGSSIEKANASIGSIRSYEDSWNFFTSIYLITAILKEANRYRKRDHSVSSSLTRSLAKHAKQLSSIRF